MGRIGGPFDRTDELQERLQQVPGEDAQQALAATENGPPPSRWSLRAIRATVSVTSTVSTKPRPTCERMWLNRALRSRTNFSQCADKASLSIWTGTLT